MGQSVAMNAKTVALWPSSSAAVWRTPSVSLRSKESVPPEMADAKESSNVLKTYQRLLTREAIHMAVKSLSVRGESEVVYCWCASRRRGVLPLLHGPASV